MSEKGYTSKPQPTLRGYLAWAFDEYVRADDQEPGPVASSMIGDWIRQNWKILEDQYGITRERYQRETGRNVTETAGRFGRGKNVAGPGDGIGK